MKTRGGVVVRLILPGSESRNPLGQTRLRLLVSYMAVTAALMALFAFGFYTYVRGTLIERVDDTLDHVVELVERSLVVGQDADGTPRVDLEHAFASGDDDPTIEMDLIYLEWFTPTGQPLKSTAVFRRPVPLVRGRLHETVEVAPGHSLRQTTVPVRRRGMLLGYLRVSHQWFEVDKPSQQLFVDLLVGTVITLGMIGLAGWFLAEIALRPVRQAYNRLAQFTADASHELRTPLAAIQTNAQVALAAPEPTVEDHQRRLEVIERLTRRMGRLVNDLLFLARHEGVAGEAGQTPCNLGELLAQVIEEQTPLARSAGLTLQVKSIPGAIVQGNVDQLHRLLDNLIGNAIRYTGQGGKVLVSLDREGRDALIEVRDTGIGIGPDHLPYLFERFYRVDTARSRSAGGTGLGLAIARTIARNHGGEITVESIPGEGSLFRVRLSLRPNVERRGAPDAGTHVLPQQG